jgi:hypothetical protein
MRLLALEILAAHHSGGTDDAYDDDDDAGWTMGLQMTMILRVASRGNADR